MTYDAPTLPSGNQTLQWQIIQFSLIFAVESALEGISHWDVWLPEGIKNFEKKIIRATVAKFCGQNAARCAFQELSMSSSLFVFSSSISSLNLASSHWCKINISCKHLKVFEIVWVIVSINQAVAAGLVISPCLSGKPYKSHYNTTFISIFVLETIYSAH